MWIGENQQTRLLVELDFIQPSSADMKETENCCIFPPLEKKNEYMNKTKKQYKSYFYLVVE